jgi:glycosyltransferase involved in cell wall biosynthesis
MRHAQRAGVPSLFFTWQNICKCYPPPFNWIEKTSYRGSAAAIAGSSEAKEVLQRKGFRKWIWVIPQFGVDPQVFQRHGGEAIRQRFRIGGNFLVGYVGRLVVEKGLTDVLAALAKLPSEIMLLIVGSGPEEQRLKRQSRALGVANRVIWKSSVLSTEVASYMSAFDVLVLPSRTVRSWKEQFGRVLVEAMACGTPPIGSDSGEIRNVIGDAGLLVPEAQPDRFMKAIRTLHENPHLRAELAVRGRDRVLRMFTHAQLARETSKVYKALVSANACVSA